MVNVTPNPDSTVVHIEKDTGKPTKVFFNWMRDLTRVIGGFGDIVTHDASEFALAAAPPACFSVHKNGTNQTGIADVTSTLLTWSTEVYDVGGHFSSNLWTPPAGKIFLCGALLATGTLSSPAAGSLVFQKNGSDFRDVTTIQAAAAMACAGAMEDIANGSDTYGMAINMDLTAGTGTVIGSVSTYFMGHWISP